MFKMLIAAIAAVGFSTAFAQGAGTPPPAGEAGAPKAEEKAPAADAKAEHKAEHKAHDHGKMKKEKKHKGEEAH